MFASILECAEHGRQGVIGVQAHLSWACYIVRLDNGARTEGTWPATPRSRCPICDGPLSYYSYPGA